MVANSNVSVGSRPVDIAVQSKKAWRFRCIQSARGVDLIDAWHNTLSKKARAKLERAMEHLAVQEKTEWSRPHASSLGNRIYVIRFSDENRTQHRVAGHFHGESNVFILTQPAIEKDDQYDPENLLSLAGSLKDDCDDDLDRWSRECFYLDIHRREDEQPVTAVSVSRHY